MRRWTLLVLSMVLLALTTGAAAQPQQVATDNVPASDLISKSTKAVGYKVGGGDTKIDLNGTDLLPGASGEAKVEATRGATAIEVKCKGMTLPAKFGTEFLTYVLWAVSPEGRASNLGELQANSDGEASLRASTQMQTFSLIITAEPYFAVRLPSELLVLENEPRKNTKGKVFVVNEYKLMKKAQYQKKANPLALTLDLKNVPLEMYEARNAVEVAKSNGSEKYAPEIHVKAADSLKMAENLLARKANKKEIITTARQTVQFSEDARALAVQRQTEERIAQEKALAAAKAKAQAEAKAAAEAAEAKRKADEEARRQAELAAAREAKVKAEAEAAAVKAKAAADASAARAKAEAEAAAAKAKAEADALKDKEAAAKAEAERAQKAAEELRARLLQQFSQVLDTRDTDRGLVVNMSDVLFDSGKFTLRSEAREKLARIAGIIINYPGLRLEAEGHTDNVGSQEFNQKLSEQRAGSVREYLISQGISESSITSSGMAFSVPVAPNDSAAGRQKNRRVELIVSGEVIGTAIGEVKR
ncbi:MAG: OmpA/MotB domain protein [Acidobacteria bacterium]|nr:OmpA/MotB domain protein [Acidobacteriota bacterium]